MAKMQDIQRRFKVTIVVETFPSIPDNMKARYKPAEKETFFRRWAETRAADEGVKGVYVLICRKPGHLQIEPDESVARKAFTLAERDLLVENATRLMKQKQYDAALLEIANTIELNVKTNLGQRGDGGAVPVQRNPNQPVQGSSSLMGWICLGVVALLAFWLIRAIIRAFRGSGSYGGGMSGGMPGGPGGMPGGGYGPGGYGPGYGGGGGGFFSSLMGGIFGAAAGNWMYDSFFRGGHQSSSWGDTTAPGGGVGSSNQGELPADQPGAGVFGGDTDDGGGGDFGGDARAGPCFDDGDA